VQEGKERRRTGEEEGGGDHHPLLLLVLHRCRGCIRDWGYYYWASWQNG
jgi:hypothetical protein